MIKTKKAAKSSRKKGHRKTSERTELKLQSRYGCVYLDISRNRRWNHVSWGERLSSEDAFYYSEFLEESGLEKRLSQFLDENKASLGRGWSFSRGGASGSFTYLPEDLVEAVSSIVQNSMQEAMDRMEPRNWRTGT